MTLQLALVLLLLVAAVAMFVADRPRMDVVATLMIVLLPLTGAITIGEALKGFADPNIVLIAVLFVLGDGLVRTGVARRVGDWLTAQGGSSESRLIVLLMLVVGALGAFMSSTAAVAIFIPVVLRICQSTGMLPSQLMMPLSMSALISGMLTLVATAPNLVVNSELERQGIPGFGFFGITPFGLPILGLCILYVLFARRWLPRVRPADSAASRPLLRDWIKQYGLADRELRLRVSPRSILAGKRVEDVAHREQSLKLLAIERGRNFAVEVIRPVGRTVIEPGDVLLVDAPHEDIGAARLEELGVERLPLEGGGYFLDRSQDIGMVEAIVPADSALIGQSVLQARLGRERGLTPIGLRHGREVVRESLLDQRLRVGDTLLLVGFWEDLDRLREDKSDLVLLNVPAESEEILPAASKGPHAVAILLLTVALMASGIVANVHAVLIGCLLMGLFGCIDMGSAYRAVSWKTILLIVGMMPFSLALERTGAVDMAANGLVAAVGDSAPQIVLAALFIVTAGLGLFISNTATAVLMAPVGIAVAQDLGASPYPFAMTIAIAASTAFMTPVSTPLNTLVMGPGGYKFGDFVRLGVPFSLVVLVFTVIAVPILLPL